MKVTDGCLKLIKEFEGCQLESYQDQGGKWTIGFGSTDNVTPGMCIDQHDADNRLFTAVEQVSNRIQMLLKKELTDNQFSALVCFTYNVGIGNFRDSTLLQLVNLERFEEAAKEFLKWDHIGGIEIPGLLRRRMAEMVLFSS